MSEPELVTYKRTGHGVELRLNRPEKLNAVNDELINALGDSLYRFDADNDGWLAIISGEGRAFCADVASRLGSAPNRASSPYSKMTVLLADFENTKPVICAVHGYAQSADHGGHARRSRTRARRSGAQQSAARGARAGTQPAFASENSERRDIRRAC